ncbi:MAG: ABC transporter ATP-binding protein [Verrucomicrobiales bacterium]|nr:ABC transporter ATP-binding protein [Verrucomicrobiales bacterium]
MFAFLHNVWRLAKPYRFRLLLGVICGIAAGLIEPLLVANVTFVYSLIFPSAQARPLEEQLRSAPGWIQDWLLAAERALASGVREHPWAVAALVGTIPAVVLLRGLCGYLNTYLLHWVAVRAVTDLRVRLFAHLLDLSAGFYSRAKTGELISRVMNDTNSLQYILSNVTTVLVKDPVTVAGLLAYLLWQQPKLTLISLVVLPVCMVPVYVYGRKVRHSSRAMQKHAAEMTQVMSEAFSGDRIIKAYNLENTVTEQFRSTASKFISQFMRIVRSGEIPGPLLEFVGAVGVALVLLYLAFSTGKRPDSTDFLAVVMSLLLMYRPLKNLTRLYTHIEQGRAASARVFELLALEDKLPEPAHPKPLQAAGADIQFDKVEFSYEDKPVLRGIDLTIKSGQLVALVGPSGAGKTTLANLLLRFYDPSSGAVRIGGVDIREVSTRELRSQIAVVTQDTILFNDTIRRNIELGRPGATDEEIIAAAKHAHAHEFIMQKPDGYDTVIGERGVALSGGQRQRIAIARALLKNAPILILDEATSALDSESERAVQAALEELMRGRTTICIAHRLSTVQRADLIVVLDQGRVVEIGRHEELMARNGMYRRLYESQLLGH